MYYRCYTILNTMDYPTPSPALERLDSQLSQLRQTPLEDKGETLHASGLAGEVYFAYEKLRNAADYSQQHLLLRSAIERFLRRNLPLKLGRKRSPAKDLVIELTNARYIANDNVALSTINQINHFIKEYGNFYLNIVGQFEVHPDTAARWTYQILSVSIERLLQDQRLADTLVGFAFNHYLQSIDPKVFNGIRPEKISVTVFCALQRSLFNSDQATTLSSWVGLTCSSTKNIEDFIKACSDIDNHFDNPQTNKIARLINKHGAPMRALHEMLGREPDINLRDHQLVISELEATILEQYDQNRLRLKQSIKRAIAFIVITKLLVGVLLEIPYDLMFFGQINYTPLAVTFIVPIVYMASAFYGLRQPTVRNTQAVINYAERILYKTDQPIKYSLRSRIRGRKTRTWFNAIYALAIICSLGLVGWILIKAGFHIFHAIIFFSFLSATSLLRFRIMQSARELELVENQSGIFSSIGDFFYLPFIQLGQFLSDKYRQLNLVAFLLDLAIELPLKTTLRTLSNWVDFMRDKREEI